MITGIAVPEKIQAAPSEENGGADAPQGADADDETEATGGVPAPSGVDVDPQAIAARVQAALGARALSMSLDKECRCRLTVTIAGGADAELVRSLGAQVKIVDPKVVDRLQRAMGALSTLDVPARSAFGIDWEIPALRIYVSDTQSAQVQALMRDLAEWDVDVTVEPGSIVAR